VQAQQARARIVYNIQIQNNIAFNIKEQLMQAGFFFYEYIHFCQSDSAALMGTWIVAKV
jgi:hypothetical protein